MVVVVVEEPLLLLFEVAAVPAAIEDFDFDFLLVDEGGGLAFGRGVLVAEEDEGAGVALGRVEKVYVLGPDLDGAVIGGLARLLAEMAATARKLLAEV